MLVSVNTEENWDERVLELEAKVNCLETQLIQATFSFTRIMNDDDKIRFYTGFHQGNTLSHVLGVLVCFDITGDRAVLQTVSEN